MCITLPCRELTLEALCRSGFREPLLVASGGGGAAETLAGLGMRLPAQPLTADSISAAVGPASKVHTINVKTQVCARSVVMKYSQCSSLWNRSVALEDWPCACR